VAGLDNGHWKFSEQLDFKKAFGFVYLIREKETGRMYIGRKNFRSAAKLTRGFSSNWRTYTSSSKSLNALIGQNGKEAFSFIVLEQYFTAGGLGWAEVWSQCHVETPSNHGRYFNKLIEKISWKSTEIITPRHKARLDAITKI
jgi:hypothetical protein